MPPKGSPVGSPSARRSRTLILLVSCGMWLLYFDLLTSIPGCTSSSSSTGTGGSEVDAAPLVPTDAPAGIDAAGPTPDAPSGDAPSADAPLDSSGDAPLADAGSLIDGALIDASLVDAAIVDAAFIDAPIVDSSIIIDSSIVDASSLIDAI